MTDVAWNLLLAFAGFVAGIVNTIAGGGSFLTLPALMLFGLDPKLANGTNRVAVLLSSAAAVATFEKHGLLDRKLSIRLTVPTLAGVPVGALLAIYLPATLFEALFGVVFLGMAVLMATNPKKLIADTASKPPSRWDVDQAGAIARKRYERNFNPEVRLPRLVEIYEELRTARRPA